MKSETIWKELVFEDIIPQSGLSQQAHIKIEIEVDTLPPLDFETTATVFFILCEMFWLPYLFAGKMHALLFRKRQENVKGRDWYDFEWM